MVARLTPDQKAECSNHVGSTLLCFLLLFILTIFILKAIQRRRKRSKKAKERSENKKRSWRLFSLLAAVTVLGRGHCFCLSCSPL